MTLDINRYIGSIRAKPGQNWHALAFQEVQDKFNAFLLSTSQSTPSATSTAAPIVASGGSPSTSVATFKLYVNGALALKNSSNLNNILPTPTDGRAPVTFLIDNTLPVPNIGASVPNVGFVNLQGGPSYTATVSDLGKLIVFSSSSAVLFTLPDTSTLPNGWFCGASNVGTGAVSITPADNLIDNGTTLALSQFQGIPIYSDSTNYWTERGISSGGGTVPSFSDNEAPTDSGDQQNFTLANSPSPSASLQLFLVGTGYQSQFLFQGTDYTLTGNAIALGSALVGAFTLAAFYRY